MMDNERIVIPIPVVVEGKYDKMKLAQVIDADIITTDGFGIFKKSEKIALIKRLAAGGIILLCDSDGAGGVIRRYVMSAVPKELVINLYIPKIEGKEKRKSAPSKEGTLGVEGMETSLLREMFSSLAERLSERKTARKGDPITKADLYAYGFTGCKDSSRLRDRLSAAFSLPDGMTPTALLGALNILTDREGFIAAAEAISSDGEER